MIVIGSYPQDVDAAVNRQISDLALRRLACHSQRMSLISQLSGALATSISYADAPSFLWNWHGAQ